MPSAPNRDGPGGLSAAAPLPDPLAWLGDRERRANRLGRAEVSLYAPHRRRLTELAARFADSRRRLCLLGAGNCNDVDLGHLLERFAEVHLVDIDAEALAAASERLPRSARLRLHTHAPVDLSGILRELPALLAAEDAGQLAPERYASLLLPVISGSTVELLTRLPGPFDVCVSCCITTQMAATLVELLGAQHPRLEALRLAMLRVHMRTLAGLISGAWPGGVALWVTDVSSSALYPLTERLKTSSPSELLREVMCASAVYPAGDPRTMAYVCDTDPVLTGVRLVEAYPPWLWTTRQRTYLVTAERYGLSPG